MSSAHSPPAPPAPRLRPAGSLTWHVVKLAGGIVWRSFVVLCSVSWYIALVLIVANLVRLASCGVPPAR